jgi:hypothetical protein
MSEVKVYPDRASLARAAAEHFVTRASEAVAARGLFTVALSGGSTPRSTYALLASREFAPRVDWPRGLPLGLIAWTGLLFLVACWPTGPARPGRKARS